MIRSSGFGSHMDMRTRGAAQNIPMLMIVPPADINRNQIQQAMPDASFSLHGIRKLLH